MWRVGLSSSQPTSPRGARSGRPGRPAAQPAAAPTVASDLPPAHPLASRLFPTVAQHLLAGPAAVTQSSIDSLLVSSQPCAQPAPPQSLSIALPLSPAPPQSPSPALTTPVPAQHTLTQQHTPQVRLIHTGGTQLRIRYYGPRQTRNLSARENRGSGISRRVLESQPFQYVSTTYAIGTESPYPFCVRAPELTGLSLSMATEIEEHGVVEDGGETVPLFVV